MGLTKRPQDVAPKNNIIDDGILISDFEDLTLWTIGGSGTLTADTINKLFGTQGGKVTITTAGSYATIIKSIKADKIKSISFAVYVEDVAKIDNIQVQVTSTTDFSKKFSFEITSTRLKSGWNNVKITASEMTNSGGDSWGNIIKIRLIPTAVTEQTTYVTFEDLRFNRTSRAKIILQFDGPFASVYTTVLPMLRKYGFKGGLNIIPSFLEAGAPTYMTITQALELQNNYGWTVGGHSISNGDYRTLTDAQIISENEQCRDWQIANGLDSAYHHISYPRGYADDRVAKVVSGTFVKTARANARYQIVQEQPVLPLPAPEMWELNAVITWEPTTTFATNIKPLLDQSVAHGGVFNSYIHGVADSPTGDDAKTSEFQLFIDYVALLVSQGKADVVTINEWYDEYNLTKIPSKYYNWEMQKLKGIRGFVTVDMASIAAGGIATFTITVTGANVGDSVFLGAPSTIEAGLVWSGFVSATDTVTVRVLNTTTGAIDPASATWMARVIN